MKMKQFIKRSSALLLGAGIGSGMMFGAARAVMTVPEFLQSPDAGHLAANVLQGGVLVDHTREESEDLVWAVLSKKAEENRENLAVQMPYVYLQAKWISQGKNGYTGASIEDLEKVDHYLATILNRAHLSSKERSDMVAFKMDLKDKMEHFMDVHIDAFMRRHP